jgi:F420-dependent oxidoreductase-like protein
LTILIINLAARRKHMRIGLNVAIGPDGPQRHDEIVAEVREAADAGLANVWWPQLPPLDGVTPWDALTSIAATGAAVPGIGVGTSVVVSYAQHPLTLARQALTTQAVVGGRLTLGIGTSHAPLVEQAYGLSFDRPVRHLREFLDVLVPALRGEAVDVHGETVTAVGRVRIPDAPPPTVLLAALGPATLRLAGERAEGTIVTWSGPRVVEGWIVPTLQAAAAGRPAPQVVVNLPVAVTDDPDGSRRFVAERFGMAGQLPSYRAMLDREGVVSPADLAVVGDEELVAASIRRFADIGATEFLASTFGSIADRTRTLTLLAELAR